MTKLYTIALTAVLLAAATAADAHAQLDHSVPAVGSTVASSPGKVTLYFTEQLEPKFSGERYATRPARASIRVGASAAASCS